MVTKSLKRTHTPFSFCCENNQKSICASSLWRRTSTVFDRHLNRSHQSGRHFPMKGRSLLHSQNLNMLLWIVGRASFAHCLSQKVTLRTRAAFYSSKAYYSCGIFRMNRIFSESNQMNCWPSGWIRNFRRVLRSNTCKMLLLTKWSAWVLVHLP